MHEGLLGKDPSTVLERDFVRGARMSICVSVKKHTAARGPRGGGSLGKIKVSGSEDSEKCRRNVTVLSTKTAVVCSTCQPYDTEPGQQRAVLYHTAASRGRQELAGQVFKLLTSYNAYQILFIITIIT